MVSVAGGSAMDAVACMEPRQIRIGVGTVNEAEAHTPNYLMSMVNYMSDSKSKVAELKRI